MMNNMMNNWWIYNMMNNMMKKKMHLTGLAGAITISFIQSGESF